MFQHRMRQRVNRRRANNVGARRGRNDDRRFDLRLAFEPLEDRRLLTVNYALTDLGTLPGGTISLAEGINNNGQVVGSSSTSSGNQHAFLYSNGVMHDLGVLPGGTSSTAVAINNNGVVVGSSDAGASLEHAFVYSNGVMQDLGTLIGARESYANGINDSGQIVGEASFQSQQFPAVLFSNGTVTNLGTLAGPWSSANAINASGEIAGGTDTDHNINAFIDTNGVMQDIGTLPHGTFSCATAINNAGQVVGYADINTGTFYGFLYSAGTMKNLGTIPGGMSSYAQSINSSGAIVGYAALTSGAQHAFLYTNGVMVDLNSLIDPAEGWVLSGATGINDAGQIVGYGFNSSGQTDAYLLTPVTNQAVITTPPPAGVLQGSNFGLTVEVLNTQGQLDSAFNGSLTISLLNNPGASTLGGNLTVQAVNGVATFSNLTLNNPGLGYRLQVSGAVSPAGFTAVITAPLDVAGYRLVNDAGVQDLDWFGTSGGDHVLFTQTATNTVQITTSLVAGSAVNNTISVSGVTGVVAATGYGGSDTLDGSGLTTISTQLNDGDGNDTLIGGGGGANTITAGNGNNTIYGNGIGDTPNAQNGNNAISVGDGNNLIYGNYAGNGGEGGSNAIVAGNGNNTIYGNGAGSLPGNDKAGNNSIQIGDGKNTIYGNYGGNGANGAEGGNNTIVSGNGQDTIYGNFGGSGAAGAEGGNNTILTGTGNDTIYGNFGADGAEGGNNLIVAGGGNDTIYAHSGLPTTSTIATTGQDLIVGGTGTDKIYGWDASYQIGTNKTGDLIIAGTTSLNTPALQAVLSEWSSTGFLSTTTPYATRVAYISGNSGSGGANGTAYLIPGTTVFGSAAVDQIFGTPNSTEDWDLVTSSDVLHNVEPQEITLI